MTSRIRRKICQKIHEIGVSKNVFKDIRLVSKTHISGSGPIMGLNLPTAIVTNPAFYDALTNMKFHKDDFVEEVSVNAPVKNKMTRIDFKVETNTFLKHILKPELQEQQLEDNLNRAKHVVFEFSSPNIAKPFHVGHLRSTIIGNVLANIYKRLGYRTTKLNYLGDWGTQFGFLALGLQMAQITNDQLKEKPIETLYNAYVLANKEAEKKKELAEEARAIFSSLENGTDTALTSKWQAIRNYAIDDLRTTYKRLGVSFDKYDWESQYSQDAIDDILNDMRASNILQPGRDGCEIVCVGKRRVPVIKSDGSTLYLARDIAALLDRYKRYDFERMLYVVDNSQTDHFNALFTAATNYCEKLKPEMLHHVKFGRIRGMSTRQGTSIFLKDLIDEARDKMREQRKESGTTRANETMDDDSVCDVLGLTAVIVNDLKQRRQRDYEFNWKQALQTTGDTGIKLQYTHCRLHNLLQNFKDIDVADIKPDWELLQEVDAQDLLYEIARFEEIIWSAADQLEACVLVNYLFGLCNTTSRALKRLRVKQEPIAEKKLQRILLFTVAKSTLKEGMLILGLHPLEQM